MLASFKNTFNSPDTLGVISSYPLLGGEIARANAVSRYTYLLTNSLPKYQKVVVFCEKRSEKDKPYLLSENILVVPSYKLDSPFFVTSLVNQVFGMSNIGDYLIQFEFSIYGGKRVIPAFLTLLFALKMLAKNTSLVLHQVVTDLNDLSGHLGLSRNSLKIDIFNRILKVFYSLVGLLTDRVIVHDSMLKVRLSRFMNESKIVVIPHAIGDMEGRNHKSGSKSSVRKSFGLGLKDKVIGVYGYRSWYKGTDWIIQTVRQIALQYPDRNIKLLVAGGVSPTLKDTSSYKNFNRRIKRVIGAADGSVVVTGFVPEHDVWKVFEASDVMVFPYRTRMSASGAFSLTLSYKKPFLVSKTFAHGMGSKIQEFAFDLNTFSFEQKLLGILEDESQRSKSIYLGERLSRSKSWENVANLYLTNVKSDRILVANRDAIDQSLILSEA